MKAKNQLKTVRFGFEEAKWVDEYLKQNQLFESFSALARVATLAFIGQKMEVTLNPIRPSEGEKRPTFLWDYDLNDTQVREILGRPGLPEPKRWLMARILTEVRFEEVCDYLDIDEIARFLPQLRLPKKVRDRWAYAVQRWSVKK